ncbi:uncharacterized protein LOC117334764 [Pecten maximus]|uniref:uncharacterized protein LOC117334764 n=1 Tax=Pecten maximus TaxID=6579 RepID=UPI0014582C40|nr:uncharacterized protein LOC117334764 [Pecten maximus]
MMLMAFVLISVLTTAFTSDIALTPEIQAAIDKSISTKIKDLAEERARDVKQLMDRVKEVEQLHTKDVEILVKRLQEVEDKRANDARLFNNRIQEMNKHRTKDIQVLSQTLQEMADRCTSRDNGVTSKRVTQDVDKYAKDIAILSNRLTEMLSKGDADIITNRKAEGRYNTAEGSRKIAISNHSWKLKSEHDGITLEEISKRLKKEDNEFTNDVLYDSDKSQIAIDVGVGRPKLASPDRHQRVVPPESGVAFHAILNKEVVNPTQGHIIQFQDIKTNIGNNYHPTTGVFTCSRPGIYVFSWSLRVNYGPAHGINSEIVRNGVGFGRSSVGSGGSDDKFSQGSSTAAIQLDQGDEVWVRVHSLFSGTNIEPTYSMFTGFLVHEASN